MAVTSKNIFFVLNTVDPVTCCTPCNIPRKDFKLDVFINGRIYRGITNIGYFGTPPQSVILPYDTTSDSWIQTPILRNHIVRSLDTQIYKYGHQVVHDEYSQWTISCKNNVLQLTYVQYVNTYSNVPTGWLSSNLPQQYKGWILQWYPFFLSENLNWNQAVTRTFTPGITVIPSAYIFSQLYPTYTISVTINCLPYVAIWNLMQPADPGIPTVAGQLVYTLTQP